MDTQLPKAPNARDYALDAWEQVSTVVQARFLGRREYLGYMAATVCREIVSGS